MTASTTSSQGRPSGSTFEARHAAYVRDCGFPAVADRSEGKILLPVGDLVGALTMSRALGYRVNAALQVRVLAGPVIRRSRTGHWTFLTGASGVLDEITAADLLELGVAIAPAGSFIELPSPEDERLDVRCWQRNPRNLRDLPPQSAVIATTRAMATATS